jgi:group I intron endonuclease
MKNNLLDLSAKMLRGKSGIYLIKCKHHSYVGSSKSLYDRLLEHRQKLNNNKHSNDFMLKAFNKYGIHEFTYEILEFCNPDDRISREKYFIDFLKPDMNLQLDPVLRTLSVYSRQKLSKSIKDGISKGKYKTKFDYCEIDCYDYLGNYVTTYPNKEKCAEELGITNKQVQKFAGGYTKGLAYKGYRLRYKSSNIPIKTFPINPNYLGKHYKFLYDSEEGEQIAFTSVKDVWSFFSEQIIKGSNEISIKIKVKTG